MTTYARAPEVKTIADRLIKDVDEHKNLAHVRIEYVWRDKHAKSKGRTVLAAARKIGGINAFLAGSSAGLADDEANEPLFVIEVAADTWQRLTDDQRKALVDHELMHLIVEFDQDGEPKLAMRGHDLEEFAAIVRRHGLWKSDVIAFGSEVAEQLAFAIEEAESLLDPPDIEGDE